MRTNIMQLIPLLTTGKNRQSVKLDGIYLNGLGDQSYTKGEILSLFTSEKEVRTAEKIFDFFNKNKSENGEEEVLKNEELTEMVTFIARLVNYGEEEEDLFDLSRDEVERILVKNMGINDENPDTDVLLKMLEYLGKPRDCSQNISSGKFIINNTCNDCEVEKDKTDTSGKTYIITDYTSGKKFTATFGGKDTKLQVMTSQLYSLGFNNPKLAAEEIEAPNGVKGVINSKILTKNLNKTVKLGMDAFLGNTTSSKKLDFSEAFDITAGNEMKSFTFIPDELDEIVADSSKKYSRKDLIRALSTVANLEDDAITKILEENNYNEQYGEVLLKRKQFFANMLDIAKTEEQPSGMSISDYVTDVKIKAMQQAIAETSDIRDIISFQKSIDKLEDIDTKINFQKLLNEKKVELSTQSKPESVKTYTTEDIQDALVEFGYVPGKELVTCFGNTQIVKLEKTCYVKEFSEEEKQALENRYGENADKVQQRVGKFGEDAISDLLKYVNNYAQSGYDFFANKEAFIDLANMCIRTDDINSEYSNSSAYGVMTVSNAIQPDEAEKAAIKFYKGLEYWQMNNAITNQHLYETEIPPKIKEYVNSMTNLINKTSIPEDIMVYRGEGYEIFKSIELADGRSLGEAMESVVSGLPEDGQLSGQDKAKINEIISEVQNNNYTAYQERFLSTSADSEVAERFGKVSLTINLPAGSKAIAIDTIETGSVVNTGEDEILCQRGSELQITDISFNEDTKRWCITANVITN